MCSLRDTERVQEMVPPVSVALRAGDSVMQAELVVEPQKGNQTGGLENETDASEPDPGPALLRQGGERLTRDGDGAAGGGAQAAHDGQERGLS